MTDFQTKARELVNSLQKHVRLDRAYDPHISDDDEEDIATALSAAYEQGKRDEREACARIAETDSCSEAEEEYGDGYSDACFYIASAIRKRGEAE